MKGRQQPTIRNEFVKTRAIRVNVFVFYLGLSVFTCG